MTPAHGALARDRRHLPAAVAVPASRPSPKTSRSRSRPEASGGACDWAASAGGARWNCSTRPAPPSIRSGSPATLSMPEQQMVEIAKAIGADAKVVIMDEPTASLMDDEVERLFSVIGLLRAQGGGIVYISHRLEEVFAVSDRITVLRDGETVATQRRPRTLDRPTLIQTMVGRALNDVFPKRADRAGGVRAGAAAAVESRAGPSRRVVERAARRSAGRRRPRRIGQDRAGRNALRPGAGRRRRDPASTARRFASSRRRRPFSTASATCRRIGASTASCWRCRSRPTPAWRASAPSRRAA